MQFQIKIIHTRGRGILKVKILRAKYEAKLEFPGRRKGGRGDQNKKIHPWGNLNGYFLELHISLNGYLQISYPLGN